MVRKDKRADRISDYRFVQDRQYLHKSVILILIVLFRISYHKVPWFAVPPAHHEYHHANNDQPYLWPRSRFHHITALCHCHRKREMLQWPLPAFDLGVADRSSCPSGR